MLKIGISTCGNKSLSVENLELIKASGIDFIEISRYGYEDFNFSKVKENCDAAGIKIWSFHLPFMPFETIDPSSLDEKIRENTFKLLSDIIMRATKIGIDKFVLHPSAEPIADENRELHLENSIAFASRLADFVDTLGAVIAIEDLPRSCIGNCSSELERYLSANDKLRVCFDTNHLLNESISDFIKKIGQKIVTVHISDYDYVNERHWLPGEGDIQWNEVYNELLNVGYNGVWMYEINLEPRNTINRRILEFKDFYNNATEIFGGKKPTPIGEKIKNLGMWGPN